MASHLILAGDRIYFGCGACVAIDGASGILVANPRIALGDPGILGGSTASKNIFIGYRESTLDASSMVEQQWWSGRLMGSYVRHDALCDQPHANVERCGTWCRRQCSLRD